MTNLTDLVRPLEWDQDSRSVRWDGTMMMGRGYDYDGWELCREEAHGFMCSYAIWPDSITSKTFSLYGTCDGLYIQNLSKETAKAAAQSDYARRITEALDQDALRELLSEAVKAGLDMGAASHDETAQHDQRGIDYSDLVGIPISNRDELAKSVRNADLDAKRIRALATSPAVEEAVERVLRKGGE